MTPVAALWTSTSSGPSAATSSSTRSEVTLPRTSTTSAPSARSSSAVCLGRAVVAQVADRDPLRAVLREAQRDRAADAARPARDEDVHGRRGSGRVDRRRRRASRPSRSVPATRAGPRPPSTTRSPGRRDAASAPRAYRRTVVVGGQTVDELAHARADLVGEVRRRRPDEGVDVVAGRLAIHRREPSASVAECAE